MSRNKLAHFNKKNNTCDLSARAGTSFPLRPPSGSPHASSPPRTTSSSPRRRRYTEALAVAPDDTARGALHSNLSLCHLKLGATAEATAAADACIAARPTWEKGHFRKGEAAFAERRYEDAIGLYGDGLSAAPGDATIAGRVKLAKEAVGGFYFRQLLPGRDIAVQATNAVEMKVGADDDDEKKKKKTSFSFSFPSQQSDADTTRRTRRVRRTLAL